MPAIKADGDHDVFGDGSVTLISTPGHSPGHQCLLVKLPKTGAMLLSGDAVHTKANWDNNRAPDQNFDHAQSLRSLDRMAAVLKEHNAALWIGHEKSEVAAAQICARLLRVRSRHDCAVTSRLRVAIASRPPASAAQAQGPFPAARSPWWCRCRPAARPICCAGSRPRRRRGILGQQIVIENRAGGAGGRVGTEYGDALAPDGYTLLCAPQLTFSITHLVFTKSASTRAVWSRSACSRPIR